MDVSRNNRYYLTIALGMIALVVIAYGGTTLLLHRDHLNGAGNASPAALATSITQPIPANVTVVPIPTVEPQPMPTPIFNGSTTVGQAAVPWTVTQQVDPRFNRTYWAAPTEVVDQVRRNYQEMDAFYRSHIFDLNPDDERQFVTEPLLTSVIQADQQDLAHGEARGRADLIRPELEILGFNATGNAVQVAQEVHGELIPVYSLTTHQIIREEHSPIGLAVSTLLYDAGAKRWKVSETSFVPGPPGMQ